MQLDELPRFRFNFDIFHFHIFPFSSQVSSDFPFLGFDVAWGRWSVFSVYYRICNISIIILFPLSVLFGVWRGLPFFPPLSPLTFLSSSLSSLCEEIAFLSSEQTRSIVTNKIKTKSLNLRSKCVCLRTMNEYWDASF